MNTEIESGKILNWQQFKKLKAAKLDSTKFDSQDLVNFETFFAKLFSDKHDTVNTTQKQTFIDNADSINNAAGTGHPPTLNDPISQSEVKSTISSLKLGKASSLDMISNEILKYLDQENVELLTNFFNKCFTTVSL